MIKIDQNPTYTIQVGYATYTFDKEYRFEIKKTINGKTTYSVTFAEVEDMPEDYQVQEMMIATVVNYLNIHGAFMPKNDDK